MKKKKKTKKIKKPKKASKKKIKKVKTNKTKPKAKKKAVKPAVKKKVKPSPTVKRGKKNTSVYLGIGSNVGDREEYIEQAVFLLSKTPGIEIIKRSTNYETEAEGVTGQPLFMNAAIEIKTSLSAEKLLDMLQEAENALGREREVEWGPRTIDIDILFYKDEIISEENLSVPHPLVHERIFTLLPLNEIAPKLFHPVLEKTIEELLDERKTEMGDKYDDALPGSKEIKKGAADDLERW